MLDGISWKHAWKIRKSARDGAKRSMVHAEQLVTRRNQRYRDTELTCPSAQRNASTHAKTWRQNE